MKRKFYVPGTEAQMVGWFNNYSTKLGTYVGTISAITTGDVTQAAADALFFSGMFDLLVDMKTLTKSLVDFKNLETYATINGVTPTAPPITINIPAPVAIGILDRVADVSRRIKADPAYTNSIGVDLGLVGEEISIDVANSKPELKFYKEPHGWRIEFNLHKFFEGVSIYKKLPSATTFTHIADDRHAPYIDNSPVEDGTEYHAFYLMGDTEVGLQSDTTTLKVSS